MMISTTEPSWLGVTKTSWYCVMGILAFLTIVMGVKMSPGHAVTYLVVMLPILVGMFALIYRIFPEWTGVPKPPAGDDI